MFLLFKNQSVQESESWIDFREKTGREFSRSKILGSLIRADSFKSPSRPTTASSDTKGRVKRNICNPATLKTDQLGLLSRSKSKGNIKVGPVSYRSTFSPAA